MKKLVLVVYLVFSTILYAQQEPQYTQYMYNPSVINPAYAGSLGYGSLFSLYRTQWVGLEGAPKTINLSYHKPLPFINLGLGGNIVHDEIGPSTTTHAVIDVSYTLAFDNDNRLSFGIKAGGELMNIDFRKLSPSDVSDVSFQNNVVNKFSPNLGTGIYFYNSNRYLGISVPMLLKTTMFDEFSYSNVNRKQHIYFIGGKVYDLTYNVKFKPSFVTKMTFGAPLQLDLSANFLFNDRFTAGVSYRWSSALSASIGFKLSKRLAIGYGYDRETTRLSNFNSGSHEVFLQFDLFKINQQIETPRFF